MKARHEGILVPYQFDHRIKSTIYWRGQRLSDYAHFEFEVISQRPFKNTITRGVPNHHHELWLEDVVEVFISPRNKATDVTSPYFELEVSPQNKRLLLAINRPRQITYFPFNAQFESQVNIFQRNGCWHWQTKLQFFHPDLRTHSWWINVCAAIGENEREYFAASWNNQMQLDFHRPESFFLLD